MSAFGARAKRVIISLIFSSYRGAEVAFGYEEKLKNNL
jgi:hypothetical protein